MFCRVLLRKQIHKKTVIRDGHEETIVTENTQVEQDCDDPEQLHDTVKDVIDRFMAPGEEVDGNGSSCTSP